MNTRTNYWIYLLVIAMGSGSLWAVKKEKTSPESKAPAKGVTKKEEGDFIVEKRSDGSTVKYKKKTTYDFEGTDIEGLFKRPSGSYISNIKEVKGKSIIRVRRNFDDEILDSARQAK